MSNTFIEVNIFEDEDGVGYSAVLDDDGEPVVLCEGNVSNRAAARDAIFSALSKTIR